MKKYLSFLLALWLGLSLSACGGSTEQPDKTEKPAAETVEIVVFAAASMQESLNTAIESYNKTIAPEVTVITTYDSSGTLLKQIKEGSPCDLFISAAPKQLNALDGSLIGNTDKNPDGLDMIVEGSRLNLLENKVTLAVPEGNPAEIVSFDQLADLLKNGEVLLAIGNSDVPVGQYTQKILVYYGLNEEELAKAGKITYGSNVKEVTTQVVEGSVDCGVVYATDAFSAKLDVIDTATAEMCGQVIYPAAVMKNSSVPEAAQAFLDYLRGDEAMKVFEGIGFSPVQ